MVISSQVDLTAAKHTIGCDSFRLFSEFEKYDALINKQFLAEILPGPDQED